jgi:hypothetical protein
MPGGGEQAAKQEPVVDEKEITRLACQAVGKFFEQADVSVRGSNKTEASARMNEAMQRLRSSLGNHARAHDVSKLLNICESVYYDISLAAGFRGGIQGNQEFVGALNKHKREYREICEQK